MKALAFSTRSEAEARSEAEWEKVLGRARRPDDVTRYLWPVIASDAGAEVLVPDADSARLTKGERAQLAEAVLVP